MKPNLRHPSCVAALVSATALMLPTSLFAQHLFYNEPADSDLMTMDVLVSATADTTYFESLGWNPGGDFGGYTGLQTSGSSQLVIFSLWDPSIPVDASGITTIFQKPGSYTGRFGGEGVGMQYLDRSYGWQVGKAVTSVVRTWPAGNKSDVGMWTFDSGTGNWTHHATFRYPQTGITFNRWPNSFLENWSGSNKDKSRRASFYNGWKRTPTGWKALNNAIADAAGQYGVDNNRFFLTTGTTPAANVPPRLSIQSGPVPGMTPTRTTSVVAIRETAGLVSTISVGWSTDPKTGPQFKYRAQVLDQNGAVLGETSGIDPDAHRAVIPVGFQGPGLNATVAPISGISNAASPMSVRLILTNVFDIAAAPVIAPVSSPPTAGKTYRIDSVAAGTAIAVPGMSVASGTGLMLVADAQKSVLDLSRMLMPARPVIAPNAAAQSWTLRSTLMKDEYTLAVQHSAQCMDVGSMWPGKTAAPATQYPCFGTPNQVFRLQRQADNSFAIKPRIGDTCLQLDPAAGFMLTRHSCTGEPAQSWRFTEL